MDALLMCDGQPEWLQNYISSLPDSSCESQENALIFALVILMYEEGFYLSASPPNTTGQFDISLMKQLTNGVVSLNKSDGIYKFNFSHTNVPHAVFLVIIPIGGLLMFNLMAGDCKVESSILSTSEFVEWNPSSISIIKCQSLSLYFKSFVLSIKSSLLGEEVNNHHLLHLPTEILILVCKYLTLQDFYRFGITCKTTASILECETVWKHFGRQFFPLRKLNSVETWKNFVKYQIGREKEEKITLSRYHSTCWCEPFYLMGPVI